MKSPFLIILVLRKIKKDTIKNIDKTFNYSP